MDRNLVSGSNRTIDIVALRKESVDRNHTKPRKCQSSRTSLSARRAWIEMLASRLVDMSAASLSARRAWIEISTQCRLKLSKCVALRKESVDRNYIIKVTGEPPAAVALRKESVDRNLILIP